MLKAAADIVKITPKVLKFAIKPVPIIGWALAGIDVTGSAMKEFGKYKQNTTSKSSTSKSSSITS